MTLIAALSSFASALSATVFSLPAAASSVASADLLMVMGEVVVEVRSSPSSTSVTPVTPFLTVTEPSAHAPEST